MPVLLKNKITMGLNIKDIAIVLVFLGMAVIVFAVNYPIGTYDLDSDIWYRGNFLTGLIDQYDFSHDYFMSNKQFYRYYTEIYFHVPMFLLFGDYESYAAFLHPLLFFLQLSILYLLCLKLSNRRPVSFFAALIFTVSSVYFKYNGDAFGIFPVWGATGKTISLIYLCFLLILLFSFRAAVKYFLIITALTTVLIWVHPITFIGPGLAVIGASFYLFISSGEIARHGKIKGSIFGMILAVVPLGIYYGLYKANFLPNLACITDPEYNEAIRQALSERMSKPSFYYLWLELKELILLPGGLFIFVPAALSLAYIRRNKKISLIFMSMMILALSNAAIFCFDRYMGCRFQLEDVRRNIKWVYFYAFLMIVACYPEWLRNIKRAGSRYYAAMFNVCFIVISMSAFWPHLARSAKHNTLYNKLCTRGILSCKIKDDTAIDAINRDADDIAHYMKGMPASYTVAGPLWLRYKAGRNLSYCCEERYRHSGITYDLWKKRKKVCKVLDMLSFDKRKPKEYLRMMKFMGSDVFFLEKFKKVFVHGLNQYIFRKRNIDIKDFPVIYENGSFALIDTR